MSSGETSSFRLPNELKEKFDDPMRPIDAAFLIRMSELGLFSTNLDGDECPSPSINTGHFLQNIKKCDYQIRYAKADDLPALMSLETLCWPPGQRASELDISQRLAQYPEGQLVLEAAGVVAAIIYSQRLTSEDIHTVESTNAHRLHEAGGPIVHILSLNVRTDLQHFRYGDLLLEFMLEYCAAIEGVHTVVGVTRCKDYGKHAGIALEEYIFLKDERGRLVDSVLRLHQLHGADVVRLVPGYRPADAVNLGCGVLARYDLHTRRQRMFQIKQHAVNETSHFDAKGTTIEIAVAEAVSSILGRTGANSIPMEQPLFELGLDSADLLNLNERIESAFGVKLYLSFLFEHNTCNKIADYLRNSQKEPVVGEATNVGPQIESNAKNEADAELRSSPGEARHIAPKVADKDIAIVGFSCRLPGGIVDAEGLWRLLETGTSAISDIPHDRWRWPPYIDVEGEHNGIQKGGFLDDVARFDAEFFRISPKEAELMDPQHRILLELTWECLEHAGYAKRNLIDSKTGVYVGASGSDYQLRLAERNAEIDAHFGVGTSMAVLANRISYFYDWNGPSIQIDTACSSSLVAVHDAVKGLRAGECDQAVVAGVNVMCHPATSIAFFKAGMLSAEGNCKTFDKAANGYVRGEGAVVMLLKTLTAAINDEDCIYGVIKGSAVNHGGQAAGLTVPNSKRQAELIRHAHLDAAVSQETIGYVEAHGTGTRLGDPVEVQGLRQAFSNGSDIHRHAAYYCGLGSLKTNIGHLEAAAGIAGLLKAVLCVREGKIPASLHFSELNPHISLAESRFYIVSNAKFWEPAPQVSKRRAGVSSFGSGGTNAHVVLEEYVAPPRPSVPDAAPGDSVRYAILLSARTESQLQCRAERMISAIQRGDLQEKDLADIAYTLQFGREPMAFRMAFSVVNLADLQTTLDDWLRAKSARSDIYSGKVGASKDTACSSKDNFRHEQERSVDVNSLLQLWVRGAEIDWQKLWPQSRARRIPLPVYPFQGRSYWLFQSGRASSEPRLNKADKQTPKDKAISSATEIPNTRSTKITLDTVMTDADSNTPFSVDQSNAPKSTAARVALKPLANFGSLSEPAFSPTKPPVRDAQSLRAELMISLAEALYLNQKDIDPDEQFTDMGLDSISGVEWIRSVNRKYGASVPATMVYAYPNLTAFSEYLAAELENMREAIPATHKGDSTAPVAQLDAPDVKASSRDVCGLREALIRGLATALYLQPEDIDPDEQFTDMGLDSISSVEWVRAINREHGTSIAATMVYAYPNVRRFAEFLGDELLKLDNTAAIAPIRPALAMPQVEQDLTKLTNALVPPSRSLDSLPIDKAYGTESNERVAIVGMSGRYAGAPTLDQFWSNLLMGKSSIAEIPKSRWDQEKLFDPTPFAEGKTNSKWLGVMDDIDCFDPMFFGIAPAEAQIIDPQHRLFLQEAYKTLEHAGYNPQLLTGSKCGVYLGISNNEYAQILRNSTLGIADRIGNSTAIAAARIAYHLNLKGPAIAIDTACSSSLVATHLAVQALLNHEVDIAIAGGVCLYLTSELYLCMSAAGMLSRDGKCQAFDNAANGIVPGEGVGALMLKRLSDAVSDNDTIYGVISASGINQDGKTNGITAPSLESQRDLIAELYSRYNINPADISYVEAHGTGTKLGDPIELEALSAAFRESTEHRGYCALGAVKNNIGHTSAVAGIASVQKVLLSLKNNQIPPTIHFSEPNEHFDFKSSPFYVNSEPIEWRSAQANQLRRAAVSSFGISGTNAHLVIEEYRQPQSSSEQQNKLSPALIVLSARTAVQLSEYIESLHRYLVAHPGLNLTDVAFTLQVGRKAMKHRIAVICNSLEALQHTLSKILQGDAGANVYKGVIEPAANVLNLLDQDDVTQMLCTQAQKGQLAKLAALWVNGLDLDWRRLYSNPLPSRIPLPTYPFAKERYWVQGIEAAIEIEREDFAFNKYPVSNSTEAAVGKEGRPHFNAADQENRAELDAFLVRMLWSRLCAAGWFIAPAESLSERLKAWGIVPLYWRWMNETAHFFGNAGYLQFDGQGYSPTSAAQLETGSASQEWEYQAQRWQDDSAIRAQLAVAKVALHNLPEILMGIVPATRVFFPDGRPDLVGNVYKTSRVGQYVNRRLGGEVRSYIERRIKSDPNFRIRIIEIGAGTGGTSAAIFDALEVYRDHIQEYCYTDVSNGFLLDAQEKFGAKYPFLKFKIFNVERSAAEQNIELEYYDIAIAANVLHATRQIRRSVSNVKPVLKSEGILLLNEMNGNSAFRHSVFGLLEGWWLFEDEDLRIRNCPGVEPMTWRKVLYELGFGQVEFPVESMHEFGYQLISAQAARILETQSSAPQAVDCSLAPVSTSSTVTCSEADRKAIVEREITEAISLVLKVSAYEIHTDIPFSSYGVDSILGTRLIRRLNGQLGVDLNPTIIFDYSTVRQLAGYIAAQYPDSGCDQTQRVHNSHESAANQLQQSNLANHYTGRLKSAASPRAMPGKGSSVTQEPIAVIGMSGVFPGSKGVAELWSHLAQGDNLVDEIRRWNPAPNADLFKSGKREFCKQGAFLDRIDEFDPLFFNISAVEATYMEPAQRLFLQEAWKSLEDAGYAGPSMRGRRCGVYVGAVSGDYRELFEKENPPAQAMLGNASSMTAARIAYYLDLKGPAIVIDTACSSSLVAIHLACQSLWTGEAEMALAGGVFVQCTPRFVHSHNIAGMLSTTGRCHTFDSRADGFVFGEGAGAVVLKPLAAAIADGDNIYGVIRGSGVNQDGATNGIAAPSAKSQERLESEIYDRFGINPDSIQVVEAHGTGTKLGDPIEYQALTKAFRRYTERVGYCAIGSIKTNMGHAAHAAGIAGFIKLLLSIHHKKIPASLNYDIGNPHIQFEGSPFFVVTKLIDWEVQNGYPRRGAVSGFGLSGTNAHIVVEEPPVVERKRTYQGPYLVTLSAKTSAQLRTQIENLRRYCQENALADLGDIAFTLLNGRGHFNHRFACVVRDRTELLSAFDDWLNGAIGPQVFVSEQALQRKLTGQTLGDQASACVHQCKAADTFNERHAAFSEVGKLYASGADIDFGALFIPGIFYRVSLPTYPFARERYWVEKSNLPSDAPDSSGADIDALYEQLMDDLIDGALSVEDAFAMVKQFTLS